tara:strand:- start:466 stop:720 length:255 start_codon:yes stop_codon:yes gene_type:complete
MVVSILMEATMALIHDIFDYLDSSLPHHRRDHGDRTERLIPTALLWRRRAVTRRHLSSLDDDQLRDIVRSRREALPEAEKPFWQ